MATSWQNTWAMTPPCMTVHSRNGPQRTCQSSKATRNGDSHKGGTLTGDGRSSPGVRHCHPERRFCAKDPYKLFDKSFVRLGAPPVRFSQVGLCAAQRHRSYSKLVTRYSKLSLTPVPVRP